VEGLRIELTGKSFDLLLIDDVGPARKALPDLEIIEIEPVIVSEYLDGRCLRSQQALKCPSSLSIAGRDAPSHQSWFSLHYSATDKIGFSTNFRVSGKEVKPNRHARRDTTALFRANK
jgi:hypothetical protein